MSRTNNIAKSADWAEVAARIARSATEWRFRYRRWKQPHAMQDAALALGTSPRRVQALLRGEVFRIAKAEHDRLVAAWWADMDRAATELRARADQIEREAEVERLTALQLTLPLGPPKCSSRSVPGSFSGVRGEHWTEET